jgi:hypothetical protein
MQISSMIRERAGQQTDTANVPDFPTQHILPFVLVTALFFLWGMSNNLTDTQGISPGPVACGRSCPIWPQEVYCIRPEFER